MPKEQKTPGMIAAAREHLLKSGPLSTTDLSRALGFVPGAFGRQLSTFGEELGLKKWTEVRNKRTVWVWDADPNWTPPKISQAPGKTLTPKPPKISREEAAARAAEARISELLRRFRQEPPRYAGRRRNG